MNIEQINLKAGESVKVSITNYDSAIPLQWRVVQGGLQIQPDINDNVKKSAVLTDHAPGESIVVVSGSNRSITLLVNTYDMINGDLTAEISKV